MGKSKRSRSSQAAEAAAAVDERTEQDISMNTPEDEPAEQIQRVQSASSPAATTTAAVDDFEALYLRRVTAEFADDLEALRQAKDFRDGSVPMLVQALRDGAQLYSPEQRVRLAAEFRRAEEAKGKA